MIRLLIGVTYTRVCRHICQSF